MLKRLLKAEPVLATLVGSSALLPAIFLTLSAFGYPLTDQQQHAVVALVAALGALLVRSQVTPTPPKP